MLPGNGDPKREDPYLRREWAGAAEDGGHRGEQGMCFHRRWGT